MRDRFYLACFRDSVGGNVAWHAENGRGYTTDVEKACVYSRENAQRFWENGREFDQPISADHVDAKVVWKVDCQYVPTESQFLDGALHVAFAKRRWDGNDLFWASSQGDTLNFSTATKYSKEEAIAIGGAYTIIPFEVADKVKRKTFSLSDLDRRKMVEGAGLVTPAQFRRKRRKKEGSGKTRWNCPSCGKISWQYNPYDFDGCNDVMCSSSKRVFGD